MTLKQYGFLVLCTLIGATPLHGSMTKKTTALTTGAGLSAILMGIMQHKYSRLAHARYPLMQRRNILNTLLLREKQPEIAEPLKAELAIIQSKLDALHTKRGDYNMLRTALGIASTLMASGAIYEYTTTKDEPTDPKKK